MTRAKTMSTRGYVLVWAPSHPNAGANGYVFEHVLVAANALGKALPPDAVVHHINGNKRDNRPANLVVCQDQSYHRLLHTRAQALSACGDPGKRRCVLCGEWDRRENLYFRPRGRASGRHRACHSTLESARQMQTRRSARQVDAAMDTLRLEAALR